MVKVLISKENGMYGYPDGIKSTWFHRDAIILSAGRDRIFHIIHKASQ